MEAEDAPPAKRKAPATTVIEQLDWSKLGLGGGREDDSPPQFDVRGNPVSSLSQAAKADFLSITALQALILTAGNRQQEDQNTKPAAVKNEGPSLGGKGGSNW
ncbi:hypothetical protein V7S43_013087 [Phytophthora oleae]|uniref:Uncharacterized protein n=1 Tax=Phytophthora oleae TaxID=2107226 RepID=A0ABD3F740_9STRA